MSDRKPLMPKATAVWLVENTSLSFQQIAEFCGLHPLEVKGIADGDVAQGIKGHDPVPLRILNAIGKDRGAGGLRHRAIQRRAEVGAVEDVVTQDEGGGAASDERSPDDERLGQPVGAWLHRIFEIDSPIPSIAQKFSEAGGVLRSADDQDIPDPRQHERTERVVDHRLVVDGQELLRNNFRDRIKPRSRSAGQDDSFAFHV